MQGDRSRRGIGVILAGLAFALGGSLARARGHVAGHAGPLADAAPASRGVGPGAAPLGPRSGRPAVGAGPLAPAGPEITPPGSPPPAGRPRPGSIFDPGAAGPGISQSGEEPFLDGALDPRTGWPFVFLDHFRPKMDRLENFWIVQTRECPQEMGSDPWPNLRVLHFNARGDLEQRHPAELFAQAAGRTTLIQVQGSLTTPDIALGGLLWTHSWLERNGALLPETVIVAFDWPSQRVYRNATKDINEKGRRAYIAGYHLARFVQAFPPYARVCLLGQSYGGRVVPSALHLLGGGCLDSQDHDDPVNLPESRPDLQLRGVIIAGASDHTWLDPGERLDHALLGCQAFLNLYNKKDEALRLYPFLRRSDHHKALGKLGLTNRDFDRLGPLAARYAEFDVDELLGQEHTLLDAVANPQIAVRIAPYLWNFNPTPAPSQETTQTFSARLGRDGRLRRGSDAGALATRWAVRRTVNPPSRVRETHHRAGNGAVSTRHPYERDASASRPPRQARRRRVSGARRAACCRGPRRRACRRRRSGSGPRRG